MKSKAFWIIRDKDMYDMVCISDTKRGMNKSVVIGMGHEVEKILGRIINYDKRGKHRKVKLVEVK